MKIMIAVPSYWPSQDGVAHITEYLAEGLVKKGHNVYIFTSAGNGGLQVLPWKEEHAGVDIERMRVYVRWPLKLKGRDNKSTQKEYRNKIKEILPDVLMVVCSQTWTLDWIAPYLDKISCKKVFYSHGYSRLDNHSRVAEKLRNRNILGVYEELLIKRYYQNLYKIIRKFDLAIYLSELNNSYVYANAHGLQNGKILENAVEDSFLKEDMVHFKESFLKPEMQFLYVANYNENKNQKMLLKAFCEADMPGAVLQFAGFEENDYLNELRECVAQWLPQTSDKKILFNVHLSREEIYTLYRESQVFVSTSKSENCPIVHCEAAVTGMAVISTNVGDVSLKDGILLIDDVQQLKDALEKLYHNRQEAYERGKTLRNYMLKRKCRIEDKVEWLEGELSKICLEKREYIVKK